MTKKSKSATGDDRQGRVLDWEEYSRLCRLIAGRAGADVNPDAVVGIARGGVIVGATVSSILQKDFFPIKFSRRVNDKVVRKRPKLIVPPTLHLEGKNILLLDDLSVTGETMKAAVKEIKRHKPLVITTAVLVRQGIYEPDFYAIYSKEKVIFPWQAGDEEPESRDDSIPK